jgi:hypothetical protein
MPQTSTDQTTAIRRIHPLFHFGAVLLPVLFIGILLGTHLDLFHSSQTHASSNGSPTNLLALSTAHANAEALQVNVLYSPYTSVFDQISTPLKISDITVWEFGVADFNKDGKYDVYALQKANTSSGKMELHILNGAISYQSCLYEGTIPLPATQSPDQWSVGVEFFNTDLYPDLYLMQKTNTSSGKMELHILDGATNYQSFLFEGASSLTIGGNPTDWSLAVGNAWGGTGGIAHKPNVFAVQKANTSSGKMEVNILNGDASYQGSITQLVTPMGMIGNGSQRSVGIVDYFRAGYDDLYVIDVSTSSTIQVLSGQNSYQSSLLPGQAFPPPSPYTSGDERKWFFGIGGDYTSPPTPTPIPTQRPKPIPTPTPKDNPCPPKPYNCP